jgi:hypothetical protein
MPPPVKKAREPSAAQKAADSYSRYDKEAAKQDRKADQLASWGSRATYGLGFSKKESQANDAARRRLVAIADEKAQYARQNADASKKSYSRAVAAETREYDAKEARAKAEAAKAKATTRKPAVKRIP